MSDNDSRELMFRIYVMDVYTPTGDIEDATFRTSMELAYDLEEKK
ncbi:MAG: hypothetical protein RR280_09670 [Bacteroidaceae bacterium]